MHRHCLLDGKISFQVLPSDTEALASAVSRTLEKITPDICIGIGQARGYNKIAIERMAKNLKYFVSLDRKGNAPKGEPVVPGAPTAYWHSLENIEGLIPLLESHSIPTRIANDCGTHLCNQAFYHFLHWRDAHRANMKIGFVHIPALPEQVIGFWPESPFMPMEMTRKALSLIIENQIQAMS